MDSSNVLQYRAGNRRIRISKCESLLGVKSNRFGQVIRIIFGSLRICLGRLRITFANKFAKKKFCPHPFFREVLCDKEQQCEKIANYCQINLKIDSQFFGKSRKFMNQFYILISSPVTVNLKYIAKF